MNGSRKCPLNSIFGEGFKPLKIEDDAMVQISGWISPIESGLCVSVYLKPRLASNQKGGYRVEHDYFLSVLDTLTFERPQKLQVSSHDIEASLERGSCAIVAALAGNKDAQDFLKKSSARLWSMFEEAELDVCMKDAAPESPTPFCSKSL